jgi:hypothetical protein
MPPQLIKAYLYIEVPFLDAAEFKLKDSRLNVRKPRFWAILKGCSAVAREKLAWISAVHIQSSAHASLSLLTLITE